MKNEIEAKFLSINKNTVRLKLKEIGFELKIPEYLMRRKTFDFSNIDRGKNKWGRIRQEFDKVTMAIKEVRGSSINDTYEVELIVNDFNIASEFFKTCNIFPKAFQENMREVWVCNDIEVTIDTWPGLNPFIEIEGSNEELIRKTSIELGFNFDQAVFGSIDLIYEKEVGIPSKEIVSLQEITFVNPPKKTV